METPKVISCAAESCAYNRGKVCHALAVTIGSSHQMCDTYLEDSQKGGAPDAQGSVGACHMKECRFNRLLECSAAAIEVGEHQKHGDCRTFRAR